MSVLDDIKQMKAYILGVIGFATATTGILVGTFNVDPVKTTIATTATAIVALFLGWLVQKAEKRVHNELQVHIEESNELREELKECMVTNRERLDEIRKDTLRIQLSQYLTHQPENVDAILIMAEEYFCKLGGDWYMTNEFINWAEAHHVKPEIVLSCKVNRD